MGPCAKVIVICTITDSSGISYVGTNWCETPQAVCPRAPGEDYTKCKTICNQQGHAELDALKKAGIYARGSTATLHGHTHYCRDCQESLFKAGVTSLAIINQHLQD